MAVTTDQSRPVSATPATDRRPASAIIGTIVRYVLLSALALLVFMPFILSFLSTFKPQAEITAYPPTILPREWTLQNWRDTLTIKIPGAQSFIFGRWLLNSFWLAMVNVVTQLFFCSLAAYAFARMKFPGKELIFSFMIASMAIPSAITLIPGFVFYVKIGWTQGARGYLPLIIPSIAVPFGIFMLTQFFKALPKELEEAALMDGATRFGIYRTIVLPLAKPALITLAVLQFQASWNNFTGPLLFLGKVDLMTLTVGLNFFKSQFSQNYGAILVGAMFNALPILVLFFIFNKYYLDSGSLTGLAGQ